MLTQQIEQIEINIERARDLISRADALDRLGSNPDFIRIIDEGYFKDEAVRLVHLKASPSMQGERTQIEIIKQIDAIGSLMGYFQTLSQQANLAESAITADQETIAEMLLEEGEAE